ncbi:MAG: putative baseplate assembly protein [Verrucomicrobiales bacterium]|nr:putative baseplate assembly protein [Verrucomicrobiales bacterium]
MTTQYLCGNENRRQLVRDQLPPSLNGMDYMEVVSADQRTLEVHFLHNLPGQPAAVPAAPLLGPENFLITGGVRVRGIKVLTVTVSNQVATVVVNARGDFSRYRLRLVTSATNPVPPTGFDPQLSDLEFSFKAGCPSDFDCRADSSCPPVALDEPDIDYLAKDYASFRRVILDRLSVLQPGWRERSPADLQITLAEMLAYAGDHLSYFQDAVATEAYLGTARQRVSIRRHARLLDYFVHDGTNARVWVWFEPATNLALPAGTQVFTEGTSPPAPSNEEAIVFETLHAAQLRVNHIRISFHTWGDSECCLPKGTTRATLRDDPPLSLAAGDVLLMEEVLSPTTGLEADADPTRRHVVRLSSVTPSVDPLDGTPVLEVAWSDEDALPFALCLTSKVLDAAGTPQLIEASVARGNVVLADHGRTVTETEVGVRWTGSLFEARLANAPIARQGMARDAMGRLVLDPEQRPVVFDPNAPAAAAMRWEPRDALPAAVLSEPSGARWLPVRDLLSSGRFSRGFVVETDNDGRATLRFGDGVFGQAPVATARFTARYRVGNGNAGNIGAGALRHADPSLGGVLSVRNPLPAVGGVDPESNEQVRQFAPQAFRIQERAVTAADWAEVAGRHPEVQKASARFRWTGSWLTVFLTVDRRGGLPVDTTFRERLRAHLERYRLAGYDLEVTAPRFVPLDLAAHVCVKPGYFRSAIKRELLALLGSRELPDGRRGFFHPDQFTFGDPLYLSRVYQVLMSVAGVASVRIDRFQRWGEKARGELDAGVLQPADLEILQLENDPNFPEHGRLELNLDGGL